MDGMMFRGAAVLIVIALAAACTPSLPPLPAIGFILVGSHDDLGYNQSVWEGADAVARAFPDHRVLREENVPETRAAIRAMESLIRRGARVVFATSYGHLKHAVEIAREHPEVIVVHQGGISPHAGLPNFGTYWGAVYEPVYLAGIVAGLATRTGLIGYVVSFRVPPTYNNVNAFALGAQSVRPDARVHVMLTGAWCDPDKQRSAAHALVDAGADVLAQHQDCTRTVLDVAEQRGVRTVGYHADGSEVAPRAWLAGAVWDWSGTYVDLVQTIVRGKFRESHYHGDFVGTFARHNNPFVLTELGTSAPSAAASRVGAAQARFEAGGSPFAGPIHDDDGTLRVAGGTAPPTSEILQMGWFVQGVSVR